MCKPAPVGRKTPYTERGIHQLCCARCGKKARYQWSICALDNRWFPICEDCDVDLNRQVLKFMGLSTFDRNMLMKLYKARVCEGKHD